MKVSLGKTGSETNQADQNTNEIQNRSKEQARVIHDEAARYTNRQVREWSIIQARDQHRHLSQSDNSAPSTINGH